MNGELAIVVIAASVSFVSMLEIISVWILLRKKSNVEKFRAALKNQCNVEASESEIAEYMQ